MQSGDSVSRFRRNQGGEIEENRVRCTAFDLGKRRDTRILQRPAGPNPEDCPELGIASDDKGEDHEIDVGRYACVEKVPPRDEKPVEEPLNEPRSKSRGCVRTRSRCRIKN